jgi:hypothetical protein
MFDGLNSYIFATTILCIVFVPLGIWKLIDLTIWFFNHVSIHIS